MAGRGVGSILKGALYLGIALVLHGLLFMAPLGGGTGSRDGTLRGIRVRTFASTPYAPETPRMPAAAPAQQARPSDTSSKAAIPSTTAPWQSVPVDNLSRGGVGPVGGEGGIMGPSGPSDGSIPGGSSGKMTATEYERYLAKLRSKEVQGWARMSSQEMRRAWRPERDVRAGWKPGDQRTQDNASYAKRDPRGTGHDRFLDPRVQMVVASYPPTSIEAHYTAVPYPDLRLKKHEFASGWWNVYITIWTDDRGKIRKITKLRPETDGPREKVFVDQVRREIDRWTFDPVAAEIIVDVRFYVE